MLLLLLIWATFLLLSPEAYDTYRVKIDDRNHRCLARIAPFAGLLLLGLAACAHTPGAQAQLVPPHSRNQAMLEARVARLEARIRRMDLTLSLVEARPRTQQSAQELGGRRPLPLVRLTPEGDNFRAARAPSTR